MTNEFAINTAIALADAADDTAVFGLPEVGPFVHDEDEDGVEDQRGGSVVKGVYKVKYAERAAKRVGVTKKAKKALRNGCGDWLHCRLADLTLDEDNKLRVQDFCDLLDANDVKHDHWNRTTPGWQGRLRMTGRLALQRKVAESGELRLATGWTLPAPAAWIARTLR